MDNPNDDDKIGGVMTIEEVEAEERLEAQIKLLDEIIRVLTSSEKNDGNNRLSRF